MLSLSPASLSRPWPNGGTVLDIQHFHAYYHGVQALKDITFQVEERQITALIGPSGCGKSTFLKSINRINEELHYFSYKGSIYYQGKAIREYDLIQLRKSIGMVFQKPNPFPMSIRDNVLYGPRLHGVKKSQVEAILEGSLREAALWEEVKDKLHHPALGLSGGQQQRLCIARTLAVNPAVILLDEPTSALDPAATVRIEQLLFRLKEHYTIVIVTHNMQQAARISDRTAFFYEGVLEDIGDTTELFVNPQKKKTEDYITGRFG